VSGALALDETGYDRALYFPPEDVDTHKLAASDTRTTCPFKGEARYYAVDGEDVAWTYRAVYDNEKRPREGPFPDLGIRPDGRIGPEGPPTSFAVLGRLQVAGRGLAALGDQLEVHALAFGQRVHACSVNRGDVHEHVLRAVFRLDEAILASNISSAARKSGAVTNNPVAMGSLKKPSEDRTGSRKAGQNSWIARA